MAPEQTTMVWTLEIIGFMMMIGSCCFRAVEVCVVY